MDRQNQYQYDQEEKKEETENREISVLKELAHPNILELMDVFEHRKQKYLVTPYMGRDLGFIIDKGDDIPLELGDIQWIFSKIFYGVCYIHNFGIMHRVS